MIDRRRVAFHESGHAVIAYRLHRPNLLVSIRPGKQHGGIASYKPERARPLDPNVLLRPVILLPTDLRRRVETDICITVAGEIAEELGGYYRTGYREPSHDEFAAERAARYLDDLGKRERDRLEALEAAEEPRASDDDHAWRQSWAVDPDAPGLHLAWLRAVTRSILYEWPVVRAVRALAEELLVREVVGGRAARRIISQAIERRSPRREAVAAKLLDERKEKP